MKLKLPELSHLDSLIEISDVVEGLVFVPATYMAMGGSLNMSIKENCRQHIKKSLIYQGVFKYMFCKRVCFLQNGRVSGVV
jgi:hypothetical protein